MEIMDKIEDLVEKIKKGKTLLAQFQKDPVSVIEKLIGVDLPNDQLEKVVDAVKAKISMDKLGDAIGGLGKLFGK